MLIEMGAIRYIGQQSFSLFRREVGNEQGIKNLTAIPPVLKQSDTHPVDWGEAPQIRQLYGRGRECAVLEQWIVDDKSLVVAVLGTGGIGKTALTVTVAEKIQQRFDYIFWCSLQNAPPFEHILQKCILFLSDNQQVDLPHDMEDQLSLLITHLRKHACLLILDNIETILRSDDEAGHWREGYEGYGELPIAHLSSPAKDILIGYGRSPLALKGIYLLVVARIKP